MYSYWALKVIVAGEPQDDNWWELRQLDKRT